MWRSMSRRHHNGKDFAWLWWVLRLLWGQIDLLDVWKQRNRSAIMSTKICCFLPFLLNQSEENHRRRRSRLLAWEEEERRDLCSSGKSDFESILLFFFSMIIIVPTNISQIGVKFWPFPVKVLVQTQMWVCLPGNCPLSKYLHLWYCQSVNILMLSSLLGAPESLNDYPTFPPPRLFPLLASVVMPALSFEL